MSEERGGVRPAAHSETGGMSSGPRAATFGRDKAEAKEAGADGDGLRWQVCASPDELEVKWEAEALEEVLAPRWRRHFTAVAAQTAERSGNVVPLDILPVHAFDMVSDESLASLASWLKLEFASQDKSVLGELEFAQFVAATVYLESQHTSLPRALQTMLAEAQPTRTFVDFNSGHADLFARTFCMEKEDLGAKMSCSTSSADARILRQFAFTSVLSSQILQDDPELRELLGVSLDGTPCLNKDDQAKFIAETLVKTWTKPSMLSSHNETADNAIESLRSMTWIEEIYEIGVLQSLEHTGMVAAPDALVRVAYPSQDRGDQALGTSHFACVLTCIMPPKNSSSSSGSSGNKSSTEESLSSHITEFGDTSMERPMGFLMQCTCGDRTWWDMLCTKSRAQVLHVAVVSGLARVLVVQIAHQYPYEVKGYLLVETTPQARERYSQTLDKRYASHLAWAHESLDHHGPPPVFPEVFAEVALQCDLESHFKLWRAVRKYIQTCAGPLHPVRSFRPAIETVVSALTQETSYHVFRDKRFASQVSPSDSVECGQDIESRLAEQCIRDLARVSHGLFLMLSAIKEVLPFAHDLHRDFANCLLRHFSQQPGWADFTAELGVQLLARAQDNQQQLPMQQHSGSKAHISHDDAETDGAIDPPSPSFPSSDVAEAKRVMQRRPKRGPNVLRFYNDQAKRFRLDRTLAHHPMRNELVAGGKFDVNGELIDDPSSALKPKELTCVLCRRRATYHCSICQAVLHTRVPRGHTKSCFTIFHDDPVLSGTS
ncbi:Hypothetical Protein FCC1311_020292 [Hondaea fermentalgiana]|uniref:Uncharacterized protein n=1 Tax=Hondaea fermentalgiana TaxID=2315210 RepID=A0A2R5G487_9STRA|nr:Hypothetical Protein FCC1311_020292 [Hondaea fermentalgiana]|eukprot:GBG25810.1 Hypothetical Protein FCC1311_020292 [Hondaea fermentalgiana]